MQVNYVSSIEIYSNMMSNIEERLGVGVSAWVQAETRVQEPCPGLRVAEDSWLLSLLGN